MKAFTALAFLSLTLFSVPAAYADTFGSGANIFDIRFVWVGLPGNVADTTGDPNSAGSVRNSFRMGKYEISEQMIEKANALGGLGITKDTRGPDKPATSISWNEAARFVNWLNTSEGYHVAYNFPSEPGDPGYNTFQDILLWTPSDAGYNPNNLYRNSLARYVLPSVHEWYKAAYFNTSTETYFDYPTGSNSVPTPVSSGTGAGTAVWGQASDPGPADVTQAGGLSSTGTMGQGGNVYEWEETEYDLVNNSSSSVRGLRGGSWLLNGEYFADIMSSAVRLYDRAFNESSNVGFRVASVPEPSTLLLVAMASLGIMWPMRPAAR